MKDYYDYDDYSIQNLEDFTDTATAEVRQHLSEIDFIACRGVSGLIVASPVAVNLSLPLVVVRKPGESSHSRHQVTNIGEVSSGSRYVVIDDFVCTGKTMDEITRVIREVWSKRLAYCSGGEAPKRVNAWYYHTSEWDHDWT